MSHPDHLATIYMKKTLTSIDITFVKHFIAYEHEIMGWDAVVVQLENFFKKHKLYDYNRVLMDAWNTNLSGLLTAGRDKLPEKLIEILDGRAERSAEAGAFLAHLYSAPDRST